MELHFGGGGVRASGRIGTRPWPDVFLTFAHHTRGLIYSEAPGVALACFRTVPPMSSTHSLSKVD